MRALVLALLMTTTPAFANVERGREEPQASPATGRAEPRATPERTETAPAESQATPERTYREVLTPALAEIAPGGGVVIASAESFRAVPSAAWAFRDEAPPAVRAIAPGLDVYELPANAVGLVALVDDARTIVEVVRAREARPVLGAPRIAAVRTRQLAGRTRRSYTSVAARLVDAPPAQAVALVAYRIEAGRRVPLSWGAVDDDDDEIEIYLEAGACRTAEPRLGDRVVLAWLDASGRLSAMSSELVVTR